MKHNQQHNHVFKIVLAYLLERDIPTREYLVTQGFNKGFLERPPKLISEYQLLIFIDKAMKLLGQPDLGLELGKRFKVLQIGVLGYTQYTAPTLRHAAVVNKTFNRIISSWSSVNLVFRQDLVTFHFDFSQDLGKLRSCFIELEIMGIIQAIKELRQDHTIVPREVHVDYSAPTYKEQYQAFMGCPVRFDAATIKVSFDSQYFDLPLPTSDPAAHDVMLGLCKRLLATLLSKMDLAAQCKEVIRDKIDLNPSIDYVAGKLGVSKRTLSRHLHRSGDNFKNLVSKSRIELACHYLETTTLKLQLISDLCGFTSNNSFSHTFKRRMTITPSQYRIDNNHGKPTAVAHH